MEDRPGPSQSSQSRSLKDQEGTGAPGNTGFTAEFVKHANPLSDAIDFAEAVQQNWNSTGRWNHEDPDSPATASLGRRMFNCKKYERSMFVTEDADVLRWVAILVTSPDSRSTDMVHELDRALSYDIDFLNGLPERLRLRLLRHASVATAQDGDTIIEQGEIGDDFFAVLRGLVEVRLRVDLTENLSDLRKISPCNTTDHVYWTGRRARLVTSVHEARVDPVLCQLPGIATLQIPEEETQGSDEDSRDCEEDSNDCEGDSYDSVDSLGVAVEAPMQSENTVAVSVVNTLGPLVGFGHRAFEGGVKKTRQASIVATTPTILLRLPGDLCRDSLVQWRRECAVEHVEVLRRVPCMSHWSFDEIRSFAESATRRPVAPGEVLLHQGHTPTAMFIVLSGEIRLQRVVQVPDHIRRGLQLLEETRELSLRKSSRSPRGRNHQRRRPSASARVGPSMPLRSSASLRALEASAPCAAVRKREPDVPESSPSATEAAALRDITTWLRRKAAAKAAARERGQARGIVIDIETIHRGGSHGVVDLLAAFAARSLPGPGDAREREENRGTDGHHDADDSGSMAKRAADSFGWGAVESNFSLVAETRSEVLTIPREAWVPMAAKAPSKLWYTLMEAAEELPDDTEIVSRLVQRFVWDVYKFNLFRSPEGLSRAPSPFPTLPKLPKSSSSPSSSVPPPSEARIRPSDCHTAEGMKHSSQSSPRRRPWRRVRGTLAAVSELNRLSHAAAAPPEATGMVAKDADVRALMRPHVERARRRVAERRASQDAATLALASASPMNAELEQFRLPMLRRTFQYGHTNVASVPRQSSGEDVSPRAAAVVYRESERLDREWESVTSSMAMKGLRNMAKSLRQRRSSLPATSGQPRDVTFTMQAAGVPPHTALRRLGSARRSEISSGNFLTPLDFAVKHDSIRLAQRRQELGIQPRVAEGLMRRYTRYGDEWGKSGEGMGPAWATAGRRFPRPRGPTLSRSSQSPSAKGDVNVGVDGTPQELSSMAGQQVTRETNRDVEQRQSADDKSPLRDSSPVSPRRHQRQHPRQQKATPPRLTRLRTDRIRAVSPSPTGRHRGLWTPKSTRTSRLSPGSPSWTPHGSSGKRRRVQWHDTPSGVDSREEPESEADGPSATIVNDDASKAAERVIRRAKSPWSRPSTVDGKLRRPVEGETPVRVGSLLLGAQSPRSPPQSPRGPKKNQWMSPLQRMRQRSATTEQPAGDSSGERNSSSRLGGSMFSFNNEGQL